MSQSPAASSIDLPAPAPQPVARPARPPSVRARAGVPKLVEWPASNDQVTPRDRCMIAAVLVALIFFFTAVYFRYETGAHMGTDQDGYLMTARHLVDDGSLSFVPENPYQFAGRMCIMVDTKDAAGHRVAFATDASGTPIAGRIYAKYPFGYPLLAAVGRYLGGPAGAYWIDPLCTAIAIAVSYFFFRALLSPFGSLMGTILLACNPLVLFYANDSNSHSSTVMCVVIGFWGLVSMMKRDGQPGAWWRGFLGALALGYACTIRYSEFLLVLPVVFVALQQLRLTRWRFLAAIATLAGWAIPVGVLAIVCWKAFGAPWKTGYSFCREDTGFGLKYFFGDSNAVPPRAGNWETLIQQMNHTGLFFLWPLALAGLLAAWGRSWRLGALLALWIVPATALYLCYYWAPGGETTTGYLRFFMSIMPGLILAALWFIERAVRLGAEHFPRQAWVTNSMLVVFGVLVAVCIFEWFGAIDGMPGVVRYGATAGPLVLLFFILKHERPVAAQRLTPALVLGGITAFTTFINVWTIQPQLENMYIRFLAMKETADHLQDALPRGAVLFADEQTDNQLDATGGYHLYDANLFLPRAFQENQRVAAGDSRAGMDGVEEPNPLQRDRARFYVALLGEKNAAGEMVQKSPTKMQQTLIDLVKQQLDLHRRVAYLSVSRGRGQNQVGRNFIPQRPEWKVVPVATWRTEYAMPAKAPTPRWRAWQDPNVRVPDQAPWIYTLYEVNDLRK
jgi:hypothetical protein